MSQVNSLFEKSKMRGVAPKPAETASAPKAASVSKSNDATIFPTAIEQVKQAIQAQQAQQNGQTQQNRQAQQNRQTQQNRQYEYTTDTTQEKKSAPSGYDYSSLNFITTEDNKSSAQEAAFELQKTGNGLFDRSIMDLGKFETNFRNNDAWLVDVKRDLDGDGQVSDEEFEKLKLLDAIVDSHDSVLDLYINQKIEDIIKCYGPSCTYNLRAMFGDPNSDAMIELAKLGIRADAVGSHDSWQNRTYTFSLIDMSDYKGNSDEELMKYLYSPDAEIIQDEQGKKASIIFSDCLTADGTAQGAEINLASVLDQLGNECVSKSDFVNNPEEFDRLMKALEQDIQSGHFESSGETINDKYGATLTMAQAVCAVYDINGDAPGHWGTGASYESIKAKVDAMGDSLYKGGGARRGEARDFGILQTLNISSDDVVSITRSPEVDADGNVTYEIIMKNGEIKKEKVKLEKDNAKIKQQEKNNDKEASKLQEEIDKTTKEVLETFEEQKEEAEKNGEEFDDKAVLKELAKKNELDYYQLLKQI